MNVNNKIIETDGSCTMYELIQKLPVREARENNKYVFGFKDATICMEDLTLPVDGIGFTYETYESTEHIAIYGEDSIMAIVKNIADGSETHIDKFGRVNLRESV